MLSAFHIWKSFRGRTVLKDVTAVAEDRGVVCLTGESGSGKTTLLSILAGMLPADRGQILADGSPVAEWSAFRRHCAGCLPCGCSLIESLTIRENLEFAIGRTGDRTRIGRILEELGIDRIEGSCPREISSGEYKRACLARVLALDTPYLLLDEPTAGLDEESARRILEAVRTRKERKGFFIVTHDRRFLEDRELCRRIFVLKGGELFPVTEIEGHHEKT